MKKPKITRMRLIVFLITAICATLAQTPLPIYNPYPPGILPADLSTELTRVETEVHSLEGRAMARVAAVGPLTPTGNPPIFKGNGTEAIEALGEAMNYDTNISPG